MDKKTFYKLRDYQQDCINKMLWARGLEGNDLVSLPTGSGKSLIISELAKKLREPILILVPSKELLEQDQEKLERWTDVSIYSAGSNSKEVGHITLATIQSAYKNPEKFTRFKVVIIDEADLVDPKKLDGMYRKLFVGMGKPKVYGLTATPFRMDSYYRSWGNAFWQKETVHTVKHLTRYRERFWSRMLFTVHAEKLLEEGYLCKLTYHIVNLLDHNRLAFNKSKSEFDLEDFEDKFNPFMSQVAYNIKLMPDSVLVFCATITQAENLQKFIPDAEVITSKTTAKERAKAVEAFRNGTTRIIINVGVLLVGFDKPDLKNIVICRPTRSLRLHMQMLGRGMRRAPQKDTCHIHDLVGNVEFLGRAESMKIQKIEEKWNITTDTMPDGWHYKELYSYKLKPPKPKEKEAYLEPSKHN